MQSSVLILQTDYNQRTVILIHRGLLSGYTAPRGQRLSGEKIGQSARLLADIATVFALPRLRVLDTHRKSRQFT